MRVLMFGWEFPPHISGGLGTACHGLLSELPHVADVDLTFVLPHVQGGEPLEGAQLLGASEVLLTTTAYHEQLNQETLRFITVDTILRPYQTEETYAEEYQAIRESRQVANEESFGTLPFQGGYGPDLMAEIGRYAIVGRQLGLQGDYDCIHAHDWMTYLAGVEAKQASGARLIVHVHATEFDRGGEHADPWSEVAKIERHGMHHADHIIAVSHRTADMIHHRYGVPFEKITVVHNGVHQARTLGRETITKPFKEKIVLFLGRITLQKGPEYFLRAADKVLSRRKDVRFVMAGSGDLLAKSVEQMANLRLGENFHFTGFVRGRQTEEMYAMSDLYIMPSISEPFGITPFEAIKYDVPVIVSKQSGVAEVLPHAVKVDFWDVDQLAAEIERVLFEPGVTEDMRASHDEVLEAAHWQHASAKIAEVYRRICAG